MWLLNRFLSVILSGRLRLVASIALLFFLTASSASATHLLGGSFSYVQTGPGTYTIELKEYFDFVNGSPGAQDPEVPVSIFDAGTGQWIQSLVLPLTTDAPGTCAAACGYCVKVISYRKENVQLQVPPAGIKLVHERCCRSNVVQNVPQPHERGMYFSTVIPAVTNSSAVFTSLTPAVLLQNTAYSFDASATDADGDMLQYRLDDMFYGSSTSANIMPAPAMFGAAAGPWEAGFATTNMLGGPQPFQINSTTGELTATPGTTGFFQVAYAVEEYRGGQLIGTTRNEIMVFVAAASANCLTVSAPAEAATASWSVAPNPFCQQLNLQLSENVNEVAAAELISITGRVVRAQQLKIDNGKANLSLHDLRLSSGFYLLKVTAQGAIKTFRVVHQGE